MKSGYWTREFIVGLFHLITPYWNSEEKKSARLYLAAIITLTIAAVYMTLLLNEWFNSFTALCRIMTAARSTADCSVSRDWPSPISPLRYTATTCSSAWRSAGGNG